MSRNRARFQTGLSSAAVSITTHDEHDTHAVVLRVLEAMADRGRAVPSRLLEVEKIVAAVLWVAAEDPDVGEAIRNLASLFKLELPAAELERMAKVGG